MTFLIPDDVAEKFAENVPMKEQSKCVTEFMQRAPRTVTDEEWAAAAEAVNADPILNQLIEDWQGAIDPIQEPWHEPATR